MWCHKIIAICVYRFNRKSSQDCVCPKQARWPQLRPPTWWCPSMPTSNRRQLLMSHHNHHPIPKRLRPCPIRPYRPTTTTQITTRTKAAVRHLQSCQIPTIMPVRRWKCWIRSCTNSSWSRRQKRFRWVSLAENDNKTNLFFDYMYPFMNGVREFLRVLHHVDVQYPIGAMMCDESKLVYIAWKSKTTYIYEGRWWDMI